MNTLEDQLQTLSLLTHFSFSPMDEEDPKTAHFSLTDQIFDFPKPSPAEPERRNYFQMWCNEASFFQGKFSSGATPHVTPKKEKKIEIPIKKQLFSEKAKKTKLITKKSVFSKIKKSENTTSEPFSPEDVQQEDFELRTPSPKQKRTSFFNTGSASIKQMKNSGIFERPCDLDTTTNTTDFLEEDFNFIRTNLNGKNKVRERSPAASRFTEDYEVLEIIGKGCFGNVYKCRNKIDGLEYAIKCSKNQINSSNAKSLSLNEAKALATFSNSDEENPFIVRYFHAWIEEERLYLVMEHCQHSLRRLLETKAFFTDSDLRTIIRDVASGLKALHSRNVVHLDIKPENILYSNSSKFKIADLGLSRISVRVKGEDIVEGDSRYLAPELLNDISEDHLIPDLKKADIFSLGVTLYEIMTKFQIPVNGEGWHWIRSGSLQIFTQHSEKLKEIVKLMVHPNPHCRPTAEQILGCWFLREEKEMEEKWDKMENEILRERIREYEKILGIRRKKSF